MKVIIDVNKDTSKLLTDLIEKMNSTKMGDLDKSRSKFESMIKELKDQLADSPEKDQLIDFFNEVIDDDEELVTIDKDPNIIDNKTLININTRKMNKKDLIKQELGEIESILKSKAYSQLLAKYQARVFSDIEGLEGEDIEELKERLDNISDQLEEISNTEAVSDESVEVTTDEAPEESTEVTEVAEEQPTEEATEETAEVTEDADESAEEEVAADESSEEEVKTESTDEEHLAEIAEEAEKSEENDKADLERCMAELDEAMEELREAVETKDFSKVIARHYNRLFSAVEEHQDLIENIDEVKSAMDDLAEKIEKLDAEADEDESDKKEGEEKEVEDAEHAEEASDDAHEEAAEEHEETKTESDDDCWVLVKDGVETSTKGTKEEIKAQLDEFGPADRPHYEMKQCAKCCSDDEESAEVVTEEKVEDTPAASESASEPESEIPSEQEIKAIAEQAAEDAVYEQLENGLYMNEIPEDADVTAESTKEALVSPEVPEKEAEVEPMYIDEKTEMVLDPMETEEVMTASDDLMDMEDEDLILGDETEEADFCNKTFSRGTSQFLGEINTDKYAVASIEELMGF